MNRLEAGKAARDLASRAERIIETEIWCHDSSFVSALLKENFEEQFEFEQMNNLFDGSISAMKEFLEDDDLEIQELRGLNDEEIQDLAEYHGFSPLLKEIMEWWRVSDSLSRHLIRIGEPVMKNRFGSWWGRTCSGQAILMDGTIQEILTLGGSHE